MLRILCAVLLASSALAQIPSPWPGTGCNCTAYCAGECASNATSAQNMTLYRMTPYGVFNLTNKNTGDMSGDASFVLSRKDIALQCQRDPSDPRCFFAGDEPGSTDLVIEYAVEVDGNWGPYEYCNPVKNDDARGGFSCRADMSAFNSRAPKPECACARMNVTVGRWNRSISGYNAAPPPPQPRELRSPFATDRCNNFYSNRECGKCTESRGDDGYQCLWCEDSKTCHSWDAKPATGCSADQCIRSPEGAHSKCNTIANPTNCPGSYPPSPPHHHGSSGFGIWYSHPDKGECRGSHYVGDGSGCTWREVAQKRAINATCMYARLDRNVEQHDPSCFGECPQPLNHTGTCYEECYGQAIRSMNKSTLVKPWLLAFESEDPSAGGCQLVNTHQ